MKPFIYDMQFVKEQSEKNLFSVVSMFAGGGGSSTGYRLAGGNVLAINEFVPMAQEISSSVHRLGGAWFGQKTESAVTTGSTSRK